MLNTFFHRTRSRVFVTGSHLLAILLGYRRRARQNANQLLYRTESVRLPDIPAALQGVRLLFLTDPHIGGNIDARATQISLGIQTLLAGSTPLKTLVLHGGDFICD